MAADPGMTELRRGVLGPCVLALLDERPRFGLELVELRRIAAGPGTERGIDARGHHLPEGSRAH